jgi:hypothetical protein
MELIREPLDVDFYFDCRQMSDEDQKRVTDFIKKRKAAKKRRTDSKNRKKKLV